MNLNIQFHISSDYDMVTDSKCKESILLYEQPGQVQTESFGTDLEQLNLGRLKEFYPEAWEQPESDPKAAGDKGTDTAQVQSMVTKKTKRIQASLI